MSFSRIIRLLTGAAGLCLCFVPASVLACAACFGKSDSSMARGMNWGIASLLVVRFLASVKGRTSTLTFVLAGVIGYNSIPLTVFGSNIIGPVISVNAGVTIRNSSGAAFPPIGFAPSGTGGITQPPPPGMLLSPRNHAGG